MEDPKITELAGFQPKQLIAWYEFMKESCKYLLFGGSMAGGKSYLLRWSAVGIAMYYWGKYKIFGIPIGLFSEDYPTLKDRQISRIDREMPKWLGQIRDDGIDGLTFRLRDKWGGGRILLRNLDDPSKYMSTEFAAIFVDELTRNEEQTFQDLRNRLRYPGVDQVKFMGATNPGGIGHAWVKKLFVDKNTDDPEQERFFYVHANVYDNQFVSKTYVKQLESLPEAKRKAYLDGSWDVFEGQVFTEFNRQHHVIKQIFPLKSVPHYLSFDWGYSAPFACYASAFIPMKSEDGQVFNRVVTYQEWYGIEKTEREWADIIYNKSLMAKFSDGYADSSMFNPKTDGSQSIANEFEKRWDELHKSRWLTLKQGTKNRLSRVAATHNWLSIAPDGLPYWLITENCLNLIRTLPMLVYDEHKIEDVDCFVAGTLIDTNKGKISIENIKTGDMIATPIGYRKAYIVGKQKKTPITTIVLSNGKTLQGTSYHKIFVQGKGLVELQKCNVHDILIQKNICHINPLLTTILNIENMTAEDIISRMGHILKKDTSRFISKFGRIILEKFLKSIVYTIKIIIRITMLLKIWNSLSRENTHYYTTGRELKMENYQINLKNGEHQKKEKKYYQIMRKKCIKELLGGNFRAVIVDQLLKHNTKCKRFAIIVENFKGIQNIFVRYVVNTLCKRKMENEQHKPVHILAVGHSDDKEVYRLRVEQSHLYFANDILVTNTTQEDHAWDSISYMLTQVKFIGILGGIRRSAGQRAKLIERIQRFKPMRATIITEQQTDDLLKAFETAKVQNKDWRAV